MSRKQFGKYWEVVRELVPGGQSWTYVVRNISNSDDAEYVLKRLKNRNRIGRFESELRAIRSLNHPNIIRVIDADLDDEDPYIVTEFCTGGELTYDKISRFSLAEKLQIFSVVSAAVGHAHQNGVIHRDVKPANVLLKDDGATPVVADFGICLSTENGLERMTEFEEQVGARFYMAPELADGRLEDVTPACDVYSLGKLLYWMLSGRIFDREKHASEAWDLRNTLSEGCIRSIYDEVFSKSIRESPAERFPNATELSETVLQLIEKDKAGGRYLDANVPSRCIFCGIGKYQKKAVLPRVTAIPLSPIHGQGVQNFQVDYSNNYGIQSPPVSSLPAGNISQDLYTRHLVLKCDNCGNLQFFHFEGPNGSWKNAVPEIN